MFILELSNTSLTRAHKPVALDLSISVIRKQKNENKSFMKVLHELRYKESRLKNIIVVFSSPYHEFFNLPVFFVDSATTKESYL